ncbi:hypothetical protein T10_7553 [Trichinella papuae]|uniref:Uncharacterized protein n=1 Tax=Trichinella papuae TaxID=268474 RepID=A0A0V1MRI4_9BILA|nr:hypothetical protein T10_7553 [Trichinella papuae]
MEKTEEVERDSTRQCRIKGFFQVRFEYGRVAFLLYEKMSIYICGRTVVTSEDEWEKHVKLDLRSGVLIDKDCGMHLPSKSGMHEHDSVLKPTCAKSWKSRNQR